jgi:hypothetical protein
MKSVAIICLLVVLASGINVRRRTDSGSNFLEKLKDLAQTNEFTYNLVSAL